MLKRVFLAICVCLLLPALVLRAQAPQLIDSALADLSQRVGRALTLDDLINWTFTQSNYPDASLGCPQPGLVYAQMITPGVQFVLTYAGNNYDYRISADRTLVVLCGVTAAPPTPADENCPPAGDAAYLLPRVSVGGQARVTEGGIPNLMRSGPGQSGSVVGEIPPGGVFAVLDGPRCSTLDKLIWWQVNYNGTLGWTAEGQAGEYWIEPLGAGGVPATATPALSTSQRITADTLAKVGRIGNLGGATGPAALSPQGDLIVMGLANGSLGVFDTLNGPMVVEVSGAHLGGVSAIAFGAEGRLLASAGQDGTIIVWEIGRSGTFGGTRSLTMAWGTGERQAIAERARLSGATGAIRALAFSPDGLLLAAGGDDQTLWLWSLGGSPPAANTTITPQATLTGQPAPIVSLMFGSSGTRLFSTGADGSGYIWGLTG